MTALLILLVPALAGGAVHDVPDDHETIQAAVDAAAAGDTIRVAPGDYVGNIVIEEKGPLTFIGAKGPTETTIDGDEAGPVFHLARCPGTIALEGLTLARGFTEGFGGGVLSEQTDVMMRNCYILDNTAESQGGGVCFVQCTRYDIDRCRFERNESEAAAAVSIVGGRGVVSQCVFRENTGGLILSTEFSGCDVLGNLFAQNLSTGIGVVACLASLTSSVENNTITMNLGKEEYGAIIGQKGDLRIERNLVCRNEGVLGIQVGSPDGLIRLKQNNVWQNEGGPYDGTEDGEGDISADPLFCDADNGDFRLSPGSPCLPDQDHPLIGAFGEGCD
jgi:hypothetical protein